jgi:hypothetical protein
VRSSPETVIVADPLLSGTEHPVGFRVRVVDVCPKLPESGAWGCWPPRIRTPAAMPTTAAAAIAIRRRFRFMDDRLFGCCTLSCQDNKGIAHCRERGGANRPRPGCSRRGYECCTTADWIALYRSSPVDFASKVGVRQQGSSSYE